MRNPVSFRRFPGAAIAAFWREKSGVSAVFFSIVLVPLMGFMGLAVDYAASLHVKAKLDGAGDAAVLAAVLNAKAAIVAANNDTTISAKIEADAQTVAENMFKARIGSLASKFAPHAYVKRDGLAVTAKLDYSGTRQRYLSSLFGRVSATAELSGSAEAGLSLPMYEEVHLLLDTSESMGIGASVADQKLGLKVVGCAFLCHQPNAAMAGNTLNEGRAKGMRIRLDVLKDAVKAMLREASRTRSFTTQFKFAVHSFGNQLKTWVNTSDSSSYDFTKLQSVINGIDLLSSHYGTNFHVVMPAFSQTIKTTPGNGSTPDRPKVAAVIITDGMEDFRDTRGLDNDVLDPTWTDSFTFLPTAPKSAKYIQTLDPALCAPLKSKQVDVYVLYVKYIAPLQKGGGDTTGLEEQISLIEPRLRSCASSTRTFFTANSPEEINSAVQALFNSLMKPATLME